ncbi:hypothetical protein HY417_03705 [Candidatus Kaiserbacteria bacterium]|nr:hypothetical protein [Candidatus Kaiserbacteria bacterium]
MKNGFFEQLRRDAREVRLSAKEREVMRRALEKSLALPSLVKSPIRVTPSPFLFISSKLVAPLAFVLIITIVGGGTVYAAEGAVPGDTLYPIKVNVNEKVEVALAVSNEAKAAVHAKFAERRMREAEVLAEQGRLTSATKTEIEIRLDQHAAAVEIAAEEVGRENPVAAEELSRRLSSILEAHGALIERIAEEVGDGESREESKRLGEALRERGKKFARADQGISVMAMRSSSGDIEVEAFAESDGSAVSAAIVIEREANPVVLRIGERASITLIEAEAHLEALRKNLNATTTERVKKQIEKTREFIKKLHSDDKQGSEKALKDAEKLKVFIEAQEQFETRALLPAPEDDEEEKANEKQEGDPEGDEDILPALQL